MELVGAEMAGVTEFGNNAKARHFYQMLHGKLERPILENKFRGTSTSK